MLGMGESSNATVMTISSRSLTGWSSKLSSITEKVNRGGRAPVPRSHGNIGRKVWIGRISFVVLLAMVAVFFGWLSFALLENGEHTLTEAQFEAIANRAVYSALTNTKKKRMGTVALASVISGQNPDPASWPFVYVNRYEQIAMDLVDTSKGCNMGFTPIVQPDQVPAFEDHAYQWYEELRKPEPFPEGTGVSPFGKGVWAKDAEGNKYHDLTGNGTFLTPLLYRSNGASDKLLWNYHMDPFLGGLVDLAYDCALDVQRRGEMFVNRRRLGDAEDKELPPSLEECVLISEMLANRTSSTQKAPTGPGAKMLTPVYAADDPFIIRGFIFQSIVWGEVMMGTYDNMIKGIDIVLTGNDKIHTYNVRDGDAYPMGDGDLHDRQFDHFAVPITITPPELFAKDSVIYTMTLYPTQELFDTYATTNPRKATIGAVCVLLLTSAIFFLYDLLVRRQVGAKRDLLDAKRKFVRFVSHEVRTPLNSVCMGLTLMKGEMASIMKSIDGGDDKKKKDGDNEELLPLFDAPAAASAPAPLFDPPVAPPASTPAPKQRGLTSEKAQEWLTLTEEVAANANSAVAVLNDLLNYDKVESGQLSLELSVVPIFDLVERTVAEFKLPALKKQIKMVVDTPITGDVEQPQQMLGGQHHKDEKYVIGDVVRLTQVVRNLVSNAVKFTPANGDITIEATWYADEKRSKNQKPVRFQLQSPEETRSFMLQGSLVLTVTDTGAGMTKEQVEEVFNQGSQFNVNNLQAGKGSGLGTWIAKGIVKQHGGTLRASSEGLGLGTTFTVDLPIYHVPIQHQPKKKSSSSRSLNSMGKSDEERFNILVVDDAKMNLKLLTKLLEKKGHTVDGAEDGQQAVDKVQERIDAGQEHYDAILMDYEMPVMDGPTAVKQIRAMGSDSFIVGVTGNIMAEDVAVFKEAGVHSVIPKPVKLSDLEELFIEWL